MYLKIFYQEADYARLNYIRENNGISVLTLNRPNQRNALNKIMRQQFITGFIEFNADEKQRALVITGAGDRAFCAGQDLEEA